MSEYRSEFPILSTYLYLDHAGIAPISQRVVDAVQQHLVEYSHGAAFHYPAWSKRVSSVRTAAASLIHAEEDEVAFVRSTSHGLSLVAEGLTWKRGDHVVVCEKDFPSNLFPWMHVKRKGIDVRFVPFRGGRIAFEDIERAVDDHTRLVSMSSVQFTNGFRIDLERLGRFCRERGILFCVDAIQSLGILPMDVKACCIDFLSADAHKWLLGPEGIGIFYCSRERTELLSPAITGWKSVSDEGNFELPVFKLKTNALRFEEGSFNLLGIIGLGAAIDLLREAGQERIEEQVLELGECIIRRADERGLPVWSPRERRERGGIVTVGGFEDPGWIRQVLGQHGIMVNVRGGGIRISPHFYNTEEDIENLFRELDVVLKENKI